MSSIQETLFDLLLNALIQIGFFAMVAAVFAGLVAKVKARHQHSFYLAVLLFCLVVPIVNTFWHTPSIVFAEKSRQPVLPDTLGVTQGSWIWQWHSTQRTQFIIPRGFRSWIVVIWGVLILLRMVRFSLAVCRVLRLRRDASALSPVQFGSAGHMLEANCRVALLESPAIDDPVTVGVFHPAILFPSKLLPELGEQDFAAILAHEYGHIRRKDFAVHILCELISLPVAWHPGIGYLMSRISQARELACDEYAATRLGKRRSYAKSLLRLASLCLHVPRSEAPAVGIFDGDNLEARIMMLTEKALSLSRAGAMGLILATSITFGAGAVLAQAISLQASSLSSNNTEKFAGTWHWMFNGRSFATMVLVRGGSGFTGTVTGSRIALNDDGTLRQADPSDDDKPRPIAKARMENSALRVTVADGFEFIVTLKDDTHAEIRPVGAPPNMKPIAADKAHR